MTDLYLKAVDEAAMNATLLSAGLIVEVSDDEATILVPAPGISIDVIGPIIKVIGYDENGDPIFKKYPEWHVNLRCFSLTEEQEAAIEHIKIVPPEVPYRVWG